MLPSETLSTSVRRPEVRVNVFFGELKKEYGFMCDSYAWSLVVRGKSVFGVWDLSKNMPGVYGLREDSFS